MIIETRQKNGVRPESKNLPCPHKIIIFLHLLARDKLQETHKEFDN